MRHKLVTYESLENVGPSGLKRGGGCSFNALTDVAIEYRPFGPETTGEQQWTNVA